MEKSLIAKLRQSFEDAAFDHQGVEAWLARDIQALLGYDEWRNFTKVIDRAKSACELSGHLVEDHFVDVNKMVSLGSGSERSIPDVMLTRYGCYLVAQNGDSKKEPIAFAQTYFALQTRKQELIEERLELAERLDARGKLSQTERELSGLLYQRGVDQTGFAAIRKGDQALFGGQTTLDMKARLNVPSNRALADFLPTVTIKAKDLAAEMTNHTVRVRNMQGQPPIEQEHINNNRNVRDALTKSGIFPERLPPEEDLKKLERRVKAEAKKLPKEAQKFRRQGD